MRAMTAADATMYWASLAAGNDQFVLLAFEAPTSASGPELVSAIRRRAAGLADLHLAVESVPGDLDYPRWVPAPVREDAVVVRPGPHPWNDMLSEVAQLPRLVQDDALWRVHVFDSVTGAYGTSGAARVAVFQVSHALGDGRRASAIARALFGGAVPEPARDGPVAVDHAGLAALRGGAMIGPHLARATARGLTAWAAAEPEPDALAVGPTRANTDPGSTRVLRTLTLPTESVKVRGASTTAGVLAVLGEVLPDFLAASSGDACAEVTVAFTDHSDAERLSRNRFQTVSIGLHANVEDRGRRASLITEDLRAARRRADSPGRVAARRAAQSAPAALVCAAIRLGAAAPPPAVVSGWTVVSSVNRGAADLSFIRGRVLSTAGFPALSPVHSLTHGVHGIGDTVTVSVCAGAPLAAEVDDYVAALADAFADVE